MEDEGLLVLIPDSFSTLCLYPEEEFFISIRNGVREPVKWKECKTCFHADPMVASHMLSSTPLEDVKPNANKPETLVRDPFHSDAIYHGRLLPRKSEIDSKTIRVLDCGLYNFKVEISAEVANTSITFKSSDPRIVVGDNRGGLGKSETH
jgi:hypothetical protein